MYTTLITDNHFLLCIDCKPTNELNYVKQNFFGKVIEELNDNIDPKIVIYLCGDINKGIQSIKNNLVNIITELSYNYDQFVDNYNMITLGQIPINIYNLGIYFREFFDKNKDYFKDITTEHKFQALTESNKPNDALRSGIYLTPVEKFNDDLKFRLLRCSSNLRGPTDNFRQTDIEIVNSTNQIAKSFFNNPACLNHILAQIYENRISKAKIKAHSDKTKDMPINGLMAFCTFYKDLNEKLKWIRLLLQKYNCFN